MPHHHSYEFGPYRLDFSKCILTRAGEIISLPPKATQILMLLVAHAGELLEKDELLKEVWPDTFVEESNLTQNIFTLRRALGDERAGPTYIETVARRGYRFIAPVRIISAEENETAEAEESAPFHRPVIAVLPFLNTTGDPELEYLAEGITDNIINNLSRVSKLRVMSRSAVFRYYKANELDPQKIGKDLGANTVLIGKINSRPTGIVIGVELVDVAAGWQLWGESFDSNSKDLLEIQGAITTQLLAALQLRLTDDEEKRVTARYTENAQAYEAYLEGRYHWSRYTKKGIEKAIRHFRDAINLDPNYALAYAGIVDCYLRLATNYLPPEDDLPNSENQSIHQSSESERRITLRFEWDWKGVESELRRADELKTSYPSPHQWHFAYLVSKQLYRELFGGKPPNQSLRIGFDTSSKLASQIPSVQLTPTEEVQILCSVARDQIAIGNFEAADLILRRWSAPRKWPRLDSLNPYAAADLLFTMGTLLGSVAGTKKTIHGHTHAQAFLNGSVALFEQLGLMSRSAEARIESARCYYKQGLFDLGRETISAVYPEVPDDQPELKSSCLSVWGAIEGDSGRLKDSLMKLREAATTFAMTARSATVRGVHELATTLKELALSERDKRYSDEAKSHFLRVLYECEAVGHHRYVAVAENNLGFLLLSLGFYDESERRLLRSRRLFESLSDSIREAQVNETLARLYIETKQYHLAQQAIQVAVETLELTDGEAFLAEALTTSGVVAARQQRYGDAKRSFEAAYKVAERCGDQEGAGRALLIMFEEVADCLEQQEKTQISEKLKKLFVMTQQTALLVRVEKCVAEIDGNS